MGIPRGTARLLIEEHRQRPFGGTLLQLGRSTIYFTARHLQHWADLHGVALASNGEARLSHDPRLAKQGCIDDQTFFHRLGFDNVESCDLSDWEEADHQFDINKAIPADLHGRYDVVLDPGTTFQVFHLPNMMRNIHDLLKVGGRIIHAAIPSNNHMDLGFYMLSPTFFYDFYQANGYTIESAYLCQYFPYWHLGRFYSAPWKIYAYEPGCLDHLNYGRFGSRQVATFLVATKTAESRGDVVPQLSFYERSWEAFEARRDEPDAVAGEMAASSGMAAAAERLQLAHPALRRAYRPLKRLKDRVVRRFMPPRMPPLVARY